MVSAPLSLHMVFHHFLPPYEGQRPVSQWVRGMTIPKYPLNFCEESSRLLYPSLPFNVDIFLSKQGVSTRFAGIIVDAEKRSNGSNVLKEHRALVQLSTLQLWLRILPLSCRMGRLRVSVPLQEGAHSPQALQSPSLQLMGQSWMLQSCRYDTKTLTAN